MSFNKEKAFEISSDGLVFEEGITQLSGASSPELIPMDVPCLYFRTNGEIWKHLGSGSWILHESNSFSEDKILTSKNFEVLISQNGNVLRGS